MFAIENGVGLVRQHVAEDGVFLIRMLKRIIDGLFFSFSSPPQLAAFNSVELVKPGFQSKNCSNNITILILNNISMFTCQRLLRQD